MIRIEDLSLGYGDKKIFDAISCTIHPGQRIGLVGVNGAGKTTLLKIIAGMGEFDTGTVNIPKNATIGYLPQEIGSHETKATIYEEAKSAFSPLLQKQKELDEVNQKLSSPLLDKAAMKRLLCAQESLQSELQASNFFKMDAQIHRVCAGLGFDSSDLSKSVCTLSGGWLMRLHLAKILLARPDYILLDEPTNHLDLQSLCWLEDFLKDFPSAMLIISHDKAFLDNTTRITWELSLGRLTVYKGHYTFYTVEKQKRLELQQSAFENQRTRIAQTMRFVERFRAKATKASQVKSKLKQLEKMNKIELEQQEKTISFHLPPAPKSGKVVLEVQGLGKAFGAKTVLGNVSFMLMRGDKAAVVGVNGAGKSTLLKMLASQLKPDRGQICFGHNVVPAYFGQHQARELDPTWTVLEALLELGLDMPEKELRSILGTFMFHGDDVKKRVAMLSGGEKSRLALARVMAARANLLLLDEPTNHLDISSQEAVKNALSEYEGSVLIVSHNRDFVDGFVDKVLEIKDGQGIFYHGNVSDYLERQGRFLSDGIGSVAPLSRIDGSEKRQGRRANRKKLRKEASILRQQKSKALAPIKAEIERIEQEIDALEEERQSIEKQMSDPDFFKNGEKTADQTRRYALVTAGLEKAYEAWEEAMEKMESIEKQYETVLFKGKL